MSKEVKYQTTHVITSFFAQSKIHIVISCINLYDILLLIFKLEPAGKWARTGFRQGLRVPTELRGTVICYRWVYIELHGICCVVLEIKDTALMRMREGPHTNIWAAGYLYISNIFECRYRLSSHCLIDIMAIIPGSIAYSPKRS